jgi:hypothetical protein
MTSITSRHRLPALLTRHGAHPVHLDVLTDTEAHTLLSCALGDAHTTAAQQVVTELVTLCGAYPLALGLIAARLRAQPHLLADVAAELRDLGLDALDSPDPKASLLGVLSWSLRHLTTQQRTAFALLGITPKTRHRPARCHQPHWPPGYIYIHRAAGTGRRLTSHA